MVLVDGGSSAGSTRRLNAWRELIRENFVRLDIAADTEDGFVGSVRSRTHGDLQVSDVASVNQGAARTPLLARQDNLSYLQIGLVHAGEAVLCQDGRECLLRPGEFALYETDRPFSWGLRGGLWRLLVFTWPRASVPLSASESGAVTARRFNGADGLSRIISGLLTDLASSPPILSPAGEARLAHQVSDMVATLVSEVVTERGRSAVDPATADLLRRIDAFALERLSDPGLSPSSIAEAHFISTRQLHRLFARDGRSVSQWIREQRLDRCRQDLVGSSRSITEICLRWGFAEPAGFSRAFRAVYRTTPSNYRLRHAARTHMLGS